MVSNLQLGDAYYTEDNYGEATGYIFIAQRGQFIIGTSEYWHYHGRIVDQLRKMCEETLEEDGINMYVHFANKCYATYEEAEKSIR